jgi:hypothetical protein
MVIKVRLKKYKGDDMGMQTRVWGPAGWLFLHSIAQNYPWEPTRSQKKSYLTFFKETGNVLPCRYCRESYQKFIKEPSTLLDLRILRNRRTLATWLYKVHNKVNKKLGIKNNPTLNEVFEKYESFRSKCTKSKPVVQTGCITPADGNRKLGCKIVIKPLPKEKIVSEPVLTKEIKYFGSEFGKKGEAIKLISIKKSKQSGKKFTATFEIGNRKKNIHFGAAGMSDFTKHHDTVRRNRYITRHSKDLRTNDPTRAGYLSMFVLWNKKSFSASVADYRRRLKQFNKTGKFPTKIK